MGHLSSNDHSLKCLTVNVGLDVDGNTLAYHTKLLNLQKNDKKEWWKCGLLHLCAKVRISL